MDDEKVAWVLGVSPEDFRIARQHPKIEELYCDAQEGDVSADELEGAVKLVVMGEWDTVAESY